MTMGTMAGKLLSTDPWDVTPLAYWWAEHVVATARVIPRAVLQTPALRSLETVTWTLAAAADWTCTVPHHYSAAFMAAEAGVGARVWQKRSSWLRHSGFLEHGPRGTTDGWRLITPTTGL